MPNTRVPAAGGTNPQAVCRWVGIKREEIDEEVDSLYRTILDAIVHYDPGLPG